MTAQSVGQVPPEIFHFQNLDVRVVIDETGAPWFHSKDVCAALGYMNTRKAVGDHCRQDGVTKRYPITDSLGRLQHPTFIDEGNLYRLILKSNKPEAAPFEAWVCDVLLPSIRRTGRYEQGGAAPAADPVTLLNRRFMVSLDLAGKETVPA